MHITSEYTPSDYQLVEIYTMESYGSSFNYPPFEVWRKAHPDWKTTHYPSALVRENRRLKEIRETLIPEGDLYTSACRGFAGVRTLIIMTFVVWAVLLGACWLYFKH